MTQQQDPPDALSARLLVLAHHAGAVCSVNGTRYQVRLQPHGVAYEGRTAGEAWLAAARALIVARRW